jgi:hypothetical protein
MGKSGWVSLEDAARVEGVLVLYKFHWYCGRLGDLSGLFVSSRAAVSSVIGMDVYFGEVLGKHSEIYGTLEASEIEEVLVLDTESSLEVVSAIASALGCSFWVRSRSLTLSGFDPLSELGSAEGDEAMLWGGANEEMYG